MIFQFLALLLLNPSAGAGECDDIVAKIKVHQTSAEKAQVVVRNLLDYSRHIKGGFSEILRRGEQDPDFHYMDAGAGLGIAALESVFFDPESDNTALLRGSGKHFERTLSKRPARIKNLTLLGIEDLVNRITLHPRFEDIWTLKELRYLVRTSERNDANASLLLQRLRFARIAAQHPEVNLRSLHGLPLLERPISDFEEYSLITDFFGPFSYSEKKLETLYLYWKILKPGGTAFIYAPSDRALVSFTSESSKSDPWSLHEWIKKSNIFDLRASPEDHVIIIKKSARDRSHNQLERAIAETEWLPNQTAWGLPPPTFSYRTRLPPPTR